MKSHWIRGALGILAIFYVTVWNILLSGQWLSGIFEDIWAGGEGGGKDEGKDMFIGLVASQALGMYTAKCPVRDSALRTCIWIELYE